MTDNEIIKTLERCSDGTGKGIIKATLDFIKRKDEQIEGLISGQETLQKYIVEKDVEIERLKEEIKGFDQFLAETDCSIKEIKSEAVKELIEKLTEEYAHYKLTSMISLDSIFCDIKRIAKEMVGEG